MAPRTCWCGTLSFQKAGAWLPRHAVPDVAIFQRGHHFAVVIVQLSHAGGAQTLGVGAPRLHPWCLNGTQGISTQSFLMFVWGSTSGASTEIKETPSNAPLFPSVYSIKIR